MFTGLIEEIGLVLWIRATERGTQLQVAAPRIAADISRGDSIAVNGCCLTVATRRDQHLTFDLLEETLDRTNLRRLRRGSPVNLERALAADGRVGGHFVQGHIDCAASVLAFEQTRDDHRLEIELPAGFRPLRRLQRFDRHQRHQSYGSGTFAEQFHHLDHSAYKAPHQSRFA